MICHPKGFHSASVFETSLSDFHKLILTSLKVFHAKYKSNIIQYRDFNHFGNASVRTDLLQELFIQNVHPGEFEKLKYISLRVINTHPLIKENHVRCNQSPFMSKELRKAIMTRNRLLKKYRKDDNAVNPFAYKR